MHYYETCPFIICAHNYTNVTNKLGQVGLAPPFKKAMDPIYSSPPIRLRKFHWTLDHGSSSKVALKAMGSNLWLSTNKIWNFSLHPSKTMGILILSGKAMDPSYGSWPTRLKFFIGPWTMHGSSSKVALNLWTSSNKIEVFHWTLDHGSLI